MEVTREEGARRPCNIKFIFTPSPGSILPLGRGISMHGRQGTDVRRGGDREVGGGERLMGERTDEG